MEEESTKIKNLLIALAIGQLILFIISCILVYHNDNFYNFCSTVFLPFGEQSANQFLCVLLGLFPSFFFLGLFGITIAQLNKLIKEKKKWKKNLI